MQGPGPSRQNRLTAAGPFAILGRFVPKAAWAVSSVGERFLDTEEAVGSIPSPPTILRRRLNCRRLLRLRARHRLIASL